MGVGSVYEGKCQAGLMSGRHWRLRFYASVAEIDAWAGGNDPLAIKSSGLFILLLLLVNNFILNLPAHGTAES